MIEIKINKQATEIYIEGQLLKGVAAHKSTSNVKSKQQAVEIIVYEPVLMASGEAKIKRNTYTYPEDREDLLRISKLWSSVQTSQGDEDDDDEEIGDSSGNVGGNKD